MSDLGALVEGGLSGGPGVNSLGQVVGFSQLSEGRSGAFVYNPGMGMVDLNSLIDPNTRWWLEWQPNQ